MWNRLVLAVLLVGVVPSAARAPIDSEPLMAGVRVFFGPAPGFETIDLDLIGRARTRIDMAAYVLTDREVIAALEAAAVRGVRVRLYLDPEQPARSAQGGGPLGHLLRARGVEARIKAADRDMMHLKAYQVDGRFLRSGSANFSFSGERRQDNDIVVIESRDAAGAFTAQFERLWARADNDRVRP